MNPESIDMWREYTRMELGFIESLRRRWDVLGLSLTTVAKGKVEKGKGRANTEIDPSGHISLSGLGGVEPDANNQGTIEISGINQMQIETESDGLDGDEGAAARRQIMQGAIVKSVMTSAAEGMCLTGPLVYLPCFKNYLYIARYSRRSFSAALPRIGLFIQLKTLITDYPSPVELRKLLLDHLYGLIRSSLPGDAQAARLLADRHITPDLRGAAIVDGVQRANEELLADVKSRGREEIFQVYAEFVEDWCQRTINQDLVSIER